MSLPQLNHVLLWSDSAEAHGGMAEAGGGVRRWVGQKPCAHGLIQEGVAVMQWSNTESLELWQKIFEGYVAAVLGKEVPHESHHATGIVRDHAGSVCQAQIVPLTCHD